MRSLQDELSRVTVKLEETIQNTVAKDTFQKTINTQSVQTESLRNQLAALKIEQQAIVEKTQQEEAIQTKKLEELDLLIRALDGGGKHSQSIAELSGRVNDVKNQISAQTGHFNHNLNSLRTSFTEKLEETIQNTVAKDAFQTTINTQLVQTEDLKNQLAVLKIERDAIVEKTQQEEAIQTKKLKELDSLIRALDGGGKHSKSIAELRGRVDHVQNLISGQAGDFNNRLNSLQHTVEDEVKRRQGFYRPYERCEGGN